MPSLDTLSSPSVISSVSLLPNLSTVASIASSTSKSLMTWSSLSVRLTSAWSSLLQAPTVPPQKLLQPVCYSPQSLGMVLSPALEPFPARLVTRVQSSQYVELWDILMDRIPSISLTGLPGVVQPRLHEMTSLTSWLYWFLEYVAIYTHDPATHDNWHMPDFWSRKHNVMVAVVCGWIMTEYFRSR